MAARTLAYDIAAAAWSAEMLAAAGLSADRLPPVRPSGTVLGTVPEQVAGNLRLPNGVAVVLGGHDQPMGALGAGVVAPGTGLYAIGTTESLVAVLDARQEGLGRHNVACYPHVLPGRFVALAGSQSGGRVLAWLRGVVGPDGEAEASVERLVAGLADEAPAWPVLLAHLAGSGSVLNDPASTGALLGLGFETTASDLVHAALEGITLEQALSLEALRSAGVPVASLRAVGGGARSFFWLQMKADVLGLEIESVAVDDAPCCGCAILAACALGLHRSPEAAVAAMVRTAGSFRPRPRRHALHAERLALYRDLYRALRPFGPRLQAIRASALRGGP